MIIIRLSYLKSNLKREKVGNREVINGWSEQQS